MAEKVKYPRHVCVHESHVVRDQKEPFQWYAIVDDTVAPKDYITAGPSFPQFFVPRGQERGQERVFVVVNNAEEEAVATSPKNPT